MAKTPKLPMTGKPAKGPMMPSKAGKMPKGKTLPFKMPKPSARGK